MAVLNNDHRFKDLKVLTCLGVLSQSAVPTDDNRWEKSFRLLTFWYFDLVKLLQKCQLSPPSSLWREMSRGWFVPTSYVFYSLQPEKSGQCQIMWNVRSEFEVLLPFGSADCESTPWSNHVAWWMRASWILQYDWIKALSISLLFNPLSSWTIMVATFPALATKENNAFSSVTTAALLSIIYWY